MIIISQETWDKFTEKEKEKIIKEYSDMKNEPSLAYAHEYAEKCEFMEHFFGKENLQPKVIAEKCVESIKEHIDKETQDYKWSQLSKDDKDYYQVLYADPNTRKIIKDVLIRAWGEHNLQSEPEIKTWEDVVQNYGDATYIETSDGFINEDYRITLSDDFNDKIINKVIATLKIAKLIELGYDGMVTEEEWKNAIEIWYIDFDKDNNPLVCLRGLTDSNKIYTFIAFHSQEQAEEFMSYPENVELVKQYNMI